MSRVRAWAWTVPPDVLLVIPVIAQVTSTELSGWLGRVSVQLQYTTPPELTLVGAPTTTGKIILLKLSQTLAHHYLTDTVLLSTSTI